MILHSIEVSPIDPFEQVVGVVPHYDQRKHDFRASSWKKYVFKVQLDWSREVQFENGYISRCPFEPAVHVCKGLREGAKLNRYLATCLIAIGMLFCWNECIRACSSNRWSSSEKLVSSCLPWIAFRKIGPTETRLHFLMESSQKKKKSLRDFYCHMSRLG